jgi:hypothetical protein
LNSPDDDLGPQPSADGSSLYFYSDRPGGQGGYDLWVSHRDGDEWMAPSNLGPAINTPYNEYSPALSPDDSTLVFASDRPRAGEEADPAPVTWPATIREAHRGHDYDLYSVSLAPDQSSGAEPLVALNTPANEGTPSFSPVGDFLYFSSDRPGGMGGLDLYRSRLLRGHFERATNLGDPINTRFNDLDPALSQAGFALMFSSDRPVGEASRSASYALYSSTSREVFVSRGRLTSRGSGGACGPSCCGSAFPARSCAPVVPVPRCEAPPPEHPAKCLLASLAIHALLMLMLNLWGVTNSLGELFKRPGGSRVILTDAPAGAGEGLATQVRGQITGRFPRASRCASGKSRSQHPHGPTGRVAADFPSNHADHRCIACRCFSSRSARPVRVADASARRTGVGITSSSIRAVARAADIHG